MQTRKQWHFLAVALAFYVGGSASQSFAILNAVTNFYEYFDGNTVGSPPPGWITGGGGFAVVTNNLSVSSPNSLVLVNNDSPNPAYALKALSPTINSNYAERVRAGFWINPSQTDAALNIFLTDATTQPFLTVSFNNAGQITASSGGSTVGLGSYAAGRWYDVSLLFTPADNVYDVEIRTNNVVMSSATGLPFQFDADFDYFYFNSFGKIGQTTSAYFDNAFVIVPEPGAMLLAAAGCGLLWLTRRR